MSLDEFWVNAVWSLIPTIGVTALFWFVLRAIIHADRNERRAYAEVEQALRNARGRQGPLPIESEDQPPNVTQNERWG